ncbi:MAG: CoA-binding protein [Elusimicrobiales bacterium]
MKEVIAIAGVSRNEAKFGFRIFRDLIASGYCVFGLNPAGGEVLGRKIFRSLDELPEKPDTLMTVVPPEITEKLVEDCKRLGIGKVWMQPGSESRSAIDSAKAAGMEVVANACFMVEKRIW